VTGATRPSVDQPSRFLRFFKVGDIRWETTKEAPAGGRLRVVFRSGDSGREIIEAIDARGAGSGTEEVAAERPRWYYITVESANVDWTIAVDERIDAQTKP
jgi:hypothetical protein